MKAHRKVLTIPNLITGGRFLLTAVLMFLLMRPQTTGTALLALLVFILAACSDWVDGYLAPDGCRRRCSRMRYDLSAGKPG